MDEKQQQSRPQRRQTVLSNLLPVAENEFAAELDGMFAGGERMEAAFSGAKNGVVFTNKRMIIIGVLGLLGKKKQLTFVHYSRILLYAANLEGDFAHSITMNISGLGDIVLEFGRGGATEMCAYIATKLA